MVVEGIVFIGLDESAGGVVDLGGHNQGGANHGGLRINHFALHEFKFISSEHHRMAPAHTTIAGIGGDGLEEVVGVHFVFVINGNPNGHQFVAGTVHLAEHRHGGVTAVVFTMFGKVGDGFEVEFAFPFFSIGIFPIAFFGPVAEIADVFRPHFVGFITPQEPRSVNVLAEVGTVHDEGLTGSGRHRVARVVTPYS